MYSWIRLARWLPDNSKAAWQLSLIAPTFACSLQCIALYKLSHAEAQCYTIMDTAMRTNLSSWTIKITLLYTPCIKSPLKEDFLSKDNFFFEVPHKATSVMYVPTNL